MSKPKSILFLTVLVIVSVTLYFQNESPGEDKQPNWH